MLTVEEALQLKLTAWRDLGNFAVSSPTEALHHAAEQLRLENPKALPTVEPISQLAEEEFPLFGRPRELTSMPPLPTPWLDVIPPPTPGHVPDLSSYDYVIVTFSGGKDSLASLIRTLELGLSQGVDLRAAGRIELWHHNVDGQGENLFMDWPCTHAYVKAVAVALGIPVYFSWRIGGFERELLKKDAQSLAIEWEELAPDGQVVVRSTGKPSQAAIGTRMRYPQKGANLQTRWCSGALKIEVGRVALRNQERFLGARTVVISGERAEESPGRAKYTPFAPDVTNAQRRHVDRWMPVHHWTTAQAWDAIRRWGVVPHPAYRCGFGRVSCAFCIFAGPEEWATLQQLLPTGFERVAELEAQFGATIERSELSKKKAAELQARGFPFQPGQLLSVREQAMIGEAFTTIGADVEEGRRLAVRRDYEAPILVPPEQWVLPLGAFAVGAGPS